MRNLKALGLLLVFAAGSLAGCQRTLFSDADPTTDWRLHRYYDGDSARATTESRKKASEMGFGFPMGGSGEQ